MQRSGSLRPELYKDIEVASVDSFQVSSHPIHPFMNPTHRSYKPSPQPPVRDTTTECLSIFSDSPLPIVYNEITEYPSLFYSPLSHALLFSTPIGPREGLYYRVVRTLERTARHRFPPGPQETQRGSHQVRHSLYSPLPFPSLSCLPITFITFMPLYSQRCEQSFLGPTVSEHILPTIYTMPLISILYPSLALLFCSAQFRYLLFCCLQSEVRSHHHRQCAPVGQEPSMERSADALPRERLPR